MPTFYLAVRAQVDYAFALLGFIKRLLQAVLPSLARDKRILGTKKDFTSLIDAAFGDIDPHEASEEDYRLAVVAAACTEVANLCSLLTNACNCTGFSKIANHYLNTRRFMFLLMKCDDAKLNALKSIVESGDKNVGRILMRVGAVLDGRPDTYDEMDAAAKRKATIDSQRILDEVKTLAKHIDDGKSELAKHIDDGKSEIIEHVDAVAVKVDRIKLAGRRRSKYSDAAREACLRYWNEARDNVEVRNSLNTRVTHEAVFTYCASKLAPYGVTTVEQFKRMLHAAQSREYEERRKKLDEQRDGRKTRREKPVAAATRK